MRRVCEPWRGQQRFVRTFLSERRRISDYSLCRRRNITSESLQVPLVYFARIPLRKNSTAAFRCRSSVFGSVAMP
jgi:hypothetical protein